MERKIHHMGRRHIYLNEFLKAIQIAQRDSSETNKTDMGLIHGFVLTLGTLCFVAQACRKLGPFNL